MPYDANSDLPEAVRNAYSSRCQSVYRKTWNGVDGDEATRAKFAHTAAKACEESVDKAEEGEFAVTVAIAKAVGSRHIAFGVVLEPRGPDNPDTQGDFYSAEDIELAAYDFLLSVASGNAWGDLMHDEVSKVGWPVESYIAPVDFELGDQHVLAGAWVMGMYFPDEDIWDRIVKGELAAFSVGGRGTRLVTS